MHASPLSPRELRVLAEMEESLGGSAVPGRGVRITRFLRLPPSVVRLVSAHPLALAVTGLAVVSLTLLGVAVAFRHPVLLWVFTATWTLTLAGLNRLALRWSRAWMSSPQPIE